MIEFRNREDRQIILWKIKELERKNTAFLINNQKINEFNELQKKFKQLADMALNDLHFCEYFDHKSEKNKGSSVVDDSHNDFIKYSTDFDIKFHELEVMSQNIDLLMPEVQKSILNG